MRGPVKSCLLRAILKLLLSNRKRKAIFAYFFGSMNTGYFCTRLFFFSSRREVVIGVNENVDSLLQKNLYTSEEAAIHYTRSTHALLISLGAF